MKKLYKGKVIALSVVVAVSGCVLLTLSAYGNGNAMPLTQIVGVLTTPVKSAVNACCGFFSRTARYFKSVDDIYEENERLKEQLAEMEQAVREGELAVSENLQLRELLGMKQENESFELEMAEVVGISGGDWDLSYNIDKGSISGIEVYDCVICSEGMIGYVTEVGTTFSVIKIITDPETQIGAIVSRSREIGVVEGSYELMNDGKLKLSYLKRDADIIEGDTVETSGVGGVFPKGVLIGTVESISTEKHGMSNYAIIKPAVDLSALKRVFVLKDFEIEEK